MSRDKNNVNREKELGKIIGWCPSCLVPITEVELNKHCSKCFQILSTDNLSDNPITKPASKQSKAQGRFASHTDKFRAEQIKRKKGNEI